MSPKTANRLGLTASQAAEALGVSVSTVRRWSDTGALPGYRTPGGQRRFSREQLDASLPSLEQQGAVKRDCPVPARARRRAGCRPACTACPKLPNARHC